MQVRQALAAALLAATAVGAMAQELDPSDTLQGRSLASQVAQSERTRAAVLAETRNAQADGQLAVVGEKADATAVDVVPHNQAAGRTRAEAKAALAAWRKSHKLTVGELG